MNIQKNLLLLLLLFVIPVFAEDPPLDRNNLPTDDLDHEEIQQQIAQLLPNRPDLLQFREMFTFKFAAWPDGLNKTGADYRQAFNGYVLKTGTDFVYLLDRAGRTVFYYDQRQKKQGMTATDYPACRLQFDDFAVLRAGGVVVADNRINSLLFFSNSKLAGRAGFDGERNYFRHIDFVSLTGSG
jgi:hypothetical protein